MKTERQQTKAGKTIDRVSQGAAAVVLTASLAAGLEPAAVVGATALALGAGRLSGGFGAARMLAGQPRRGAGTASGRIPQPRQTA